MNYTTEQIRQAVINEYEWLCHDGIEEGEMTPEEYTTHAHTLTREQLIYEASVDQYYTLDDFMNSYGE